MVKRNTRVLREKSLLGLPPVREHKSLDVRRTNTFLLKTKLLLLQKRLCHVITNPIYANCNLKIGKTLGILQSLNNKIL